ncbi:hypothetical protein Nepgr_011037 [Nepenthes gracilis]|uniref:Phosphatidylinositol-glycan biosynthesis class X protein n=1 Tax=Nepenthes gracilis TaxID=150966 RepID=A0AAD3SEK3_NEPGR|nr:hypothetical protein Nepgr_011037 [Nepenthes gracilis]
MHSFLSVAVQFIFAAQLFASIHSSSRTTEEAGNNFEFNERISCFQCCERYISKSYFTEYEILLDSNFQDFLARKLHPDPVQTFVRILDLQRHLIGEGSHRHLSSSIRFSIQPDNISDLSMKCCEIIIIERLPSGVYADPFELEHLLQCAVFKDVAVFGDTNLELPSFLSNQSTVEVHMDATLNISSGQKNTLDLKIEIPLHARYPPLQESGYSRVRFGTPDLLMQCSIGGMIPYQNCTLMPISGVSDPQPEALVWSIPSGIKSHAGFVSVVTFASALLSAILITIASLQLSRSHEILKHA